MTMASRSLRHVLDGGAPAHDDRAAAGVIGGADAAAAQDDAAGREVRARHVLHQLVDGDLGIVDAGDAGVDHLAEIVGRDVGRHADGDAAGAVDQQVRELRRQDRRLLDRLVVVGLELDGLLVDVVEQRLGGLGQARLGVAHGRRRIAVHRAEIALAVDQRQAHREVLRHAHHRVVDRLVAVRMVFAHHVADDAGGLAERVRRIVAALLHRVEDAPVHRLQPVAHVGQRPAHDHAHRVIEVGAFHLLFDRDRADVVGWWRGRRGRRQFVFRPARAAASLLVMLVRLRRLWPAPAAGPSAGRNLAERPGRNNIYGV